MPGQIALVGGDEFRFGCEEMDHEIMLASGQSPAKVLVIPTAAVTGPAKAANDGTTHFAALGGESSHLMLLEKEHAENPDFFVPVTKADVIYFTGGNPEHLFETLKDSQFFHALLTASNQGAVLAGSSAGAMVMGAMMRRPTSEGWAEALSIVSGVAILPHHERRDQAAISKELQETAPAGLVYLGIDARTACLGNPGNWRVVGFGKVTVYMGTEWQIFHAGDKLPLGF